MNLLVFDIETIPDTDSEKKISDLDIGMLSDAEIARSMLAKRRQQTGGSEFLRHHLHRIVAISVLCKTAKDTSIFSLADTHASEADIIQEFFHLIERYTPKLISWNGSNFDLPVLHYRGLLHKVNAKRYWETGEDDQNFKWNNYLSRFHNRHIDLMDVLSGYNPKAFAPLAEISSMLGLPGKMGMDGSQVWGKYLAGEITTIRNYCETDVLNTYLVYLQYELMSGHRSANAYQKACDSLKEILQAEKKPHLLEFMHAWQKTDHETNTDKPLI